MLLMQELQLKRLWLPFTLENEESTLWRSLAWLPHGQTVMVGLTFRFSERHNFNSARHPVASTSSCWPSYSTNKLQLFSFVQVCIITDLILLLNYIQLFYYLTTVCWSNICYSQAFPDCDGKIQKITLSQKLAQTPKKCPK